MVFQVWKSEQGYSERKTGDIKGGLLQRRGAFDIHVWIERQTGEQKMNLAQVWEKIQ